MKKHILPCLLIVSMLIGLTAPTALAADAWEEKDVGYDDIEYMVSECVDFGEVDQQLNQSVSQLKQTSGTLSSYAAGLKTQLDGMSPSDPAYQSVKDQYDQATISILELNVLISTLEQSVQEVNTASEQTEIAAKTLFITYNSLRDQTNEMYREQTVFNTNLTSLEQQHSAGFVSDLQLEKTKAQSGSVQTGLEAMQSQLTALKRSFNTLLGRDYNQTLSFHALPFERLNDIGDIKFSSDLDEALSNYSGDVSGVSFNNPDYDETKGSFAASFRKLYDAMNDKNSQLTTEQATLTVEQKSYDASKKQYDAGLISQLAMTSAQDSLDTETAKVKAAKTALFTAYEQYQWAIEYGIISGS